MNEENKEKLAQLKDRLDNLIVALVLPVPANFHVKQMREELPGISKEIKDIYISEGGEDVWN